MTSVRWFLIFAISFYAMGAAFPVDAAPGPAQSGQELLTEVRIDLEAGEYAAFRFDPKKKAYRVAHLPPAPQNLQYDGAQAVKRAPAWLRERLTERIVALGWAPVRASKGPATIALTSGHLRVRGDDGREDSYSPGTRRLSYSSSGSNADEFSAEPVFFDVNGDGIKDEVRGLEDGSVVYLPSRGPAGTGAGATLRFHRDSHRFFSPRMGTAVRPAYFEDRLYVGNLDGDVIEFPRNGRDWYGRIYRVEGGDSGDRMFTAPTAGDFSGDGHPTVVTGRADGSFEAPRVSGPILDAELDAGDFSSPCLADLDGDGDLDLLSGNGEGRIILFLNTGSAGGPPSISTASTPPELAAIDVGDSSAPACGDVNGDGHMDLVVGNQEGELALFLGPKFEAAADAFAGLDVGELATPAFCGKDLMVGNLDGEILLYELSMVEGVLRFTERDSWSFRPDQDAKTVLEYYEKRYFREYLPVLGEFDRECRAAYVELLNTAPAELVDEVAFAIANTPVEVLRTMARLGQADLLVDNAQAVYDMAAELEYVRILEQSDHTTLAYRTADGKEVTAPRDVYYWWVVHPRILYEIPLSVDASYWDQSAEERGQTNSEWWKTKPEGDIHDPKGKGVFWRRGLVNDKRFGVTLKDLVAGAPTLEDALREIHDFLAHNSEGTAIMRFGYETQDLQPWQIYAKHYGSCGEHSIIGAACARTMLLPMSVISDRGEDHQWNEYWGTDGKWHHVDFCGKRNIDRPWGSTEGREHQGKTVSAVTRWRGDDRLDATTTTVHSPEPHYTTRGTGYTDTADVTVRVQDPSGRPVDGALIIVRSHWDNRNMITVWGYTSGDGTAHFDLGFEPNGGYTIEALTPLGSAGVTNFPVVENEKYELVLTTPKSKPAFATEERFTSLPAGGAESDALTARIATTTLRPPNLITAGRYRIGSWLTENAGYRGTLGHDVPVNAGDLLEVLVFSAEEYRRFRRGELCAPVIRRPLAADGNIGLEKAMEKDHVLVISNLNSLFLKASIEVAPKPGSVPPAKSPKVEWRPGPAEITVKSGEEALMAGRVDPIADVTSVWIRCSAFADGKERQAVLDKKRGIFSFEFNAGEGGPMPPGPYTATAVAKGRRGVDGVSPPLSLTVAPARIFKNQVIRQDDPDDPLAGSSWALGPFMLGAGERFLLIQTKSLTPDFDMDMYLYHDKNGNGLLDGKGEQIAAGTSPTANERIYRKAPKAGTYWLHCRGWSVEGEHALLDVEVYPLGEIRAVVGTTPAGRIKEQPLELTAEFRRFAAIDRASVRVLLDGEDVTHRGKVTADTLTLPLASNLPTDVEHKVSIRAKHASGREEVHEWTFLTDTQPPTLEILTDAADINDDGTLLLEVHAEDEGPRPTLTARRTEGRALRLKPVKNRPGVFKVKLKTADWAPGEHFVLITARDTVGNETERILHVKK